MYPEDGKDAEALLAEADRRMYIEKQKQPSRKNRRLYPRMKCRVTIELRPQDGEVPVLGNLIDVSLGGCYVETSALMPAGSKLKVIFSIDDGRLAGCRQRGANRSRVRHCHQVQRHESRGPRQDAQGSGVRAQQHHVLRQPLLLQADEDVKADVWGGHSCPPLLTLDFLIEFPGR